MFPKNIKSILIPMYSGSRISEIMAAEAVKHQLPKRIINDFRKKRDFIFNNLKGYFNHLIKPKGAFYFYLQAPNNDAFRFSLKLLKKGVLVSPAFSTKKTHFRIAYAGLEKRSLDKLVTLLKTFKN